MRWNVCLLMLVWNCETIAQSLTCTQFLFNRMINRSIKTVTELWTRFRWRSVKITRMYLELLHLEKSMLWVRGKELWSPWSSYTVLVIFLFSWLWNAFRSLSPKTGKSLYPFYLFGPLKIVSLSSRICTIVICLFRI